MTIAGFTLSQWMDIHSKRMSIQTKRSNGNHEPLEQRYSRFEKAIANDEEYKESLLGADVLASASPRYFEVSVILRLGMSPTEWKALSLSDRAELITTYKINNMIEVLERHTLETNRKQRENGMGKNNMFAKAAEQQNGQGNS